MNKMSLLMLLTAVGASAWALPYAVVLPEKPTLTEQTAASELEHYLALTVKDSLVVNGNSNIVFHVGDTEAAAKVGMLRDSFKTEEWAVKSFTRHVVLNGGGTRGVIYAVAHFLEDELDIHWWSQHEEYVPMAKAIDLGKLDMRGLPYFAHRNIYVGGIDQESRHKTCRIAILNRMNSAMDNRADFGGCFKWGKFGGCHTFSYYIQWKDYKDTHPEYFALVNGKRKQISPITGSLCLSNPEIPGIVWDVMKKNILEDEAEFAAKGLPPPRVYDFSMSDGMDFCQCEKCKTEIDAYGHSGQLLLVLNQLAAELKAFRPDLKLSTLAYHYNEAPPKIDSIVAADNVLIRLCDTSSSMVTSPYSEKNNSLKKNLQGWKPHATNIEVWDYSICYSFSEKLPDGVSYPAPSEKVYPELFKLLSENHVTGFFNEHESDAVADFWEYKCFLLHKFAENPFSDFDKLTALFMDRYYGKAGALMTEYRNELWRLAEERKAFITWDPGLAPFNYIDDNDIARLQRLFENAEKLVKDDEVRFKRVRHARNGLDSLACQRAQAKTDLYYHGPKTANIDTEASRLRLIDGWTEWTSGRHFYGPKSWWATNAVNKAEKKLLPLPKEFSGRNAADFYCWDFYYPKAPIGELVDDSASPCDGKAVRINLKEKGAEVWKDPLFLVGFHNQTGIGVSGMKGINKQELKGEGYNWYKFQEGMMPPSQWIYMSKGWGIGTRSNALALMAGKDCEVYLALKFTGPDYFPGSTEENAIYVARMLMVEKPKVATKY